ncbi:MAG: hypothetical protein ACFFCE_10435 [Promethearchaeota archaeon]
MKFGYLYLYYFKFTIEELYLNIKVKLRYGKIKLNKICFINPIEVLYEISPHKYNKWSINSRILDGDWDHSESLFENLREVKAIEQRYKEGIQWEETDFYHQVMDEHANEIEKGFNYKKHLDNVLKGVDSLYFQIKKSGYKSKNELYSNKKIYGKIVNIKIGKKILDEVALAISREGRFLFINGKHRLKIAQLFFINKISVIFVLRHKKWMEFRKKLIIFAKNCQGKKLDYQLTHPDLQDIPYKYKDLCFNLIKENLSVSQGTLIDINANLGYFCHKFEDEGFDCYALEENSICLHFLDKLKKAENKKYKIIPKSKFDDNLGLEITFDVVLALNIFESIGKEKKSDKIIEFLRRLNFKELFLVVPNSRKLRNRKLYRNFNLDQFLKDITRECFLNNAQFVGKIEENRLLYKFTSSKVYEN